jgi:hypothetical protein
VGQQRIALPGGGTLKRTRLTLCATVYKGERLLRYKPVRGFDSRLCHWNFSLTSFRPHCGPGVDTASNINEYQGVKAADA